MEVKILEQRNDTWELFMGINPILKLGQIALATNISTIKVGDGVSKYSDLITSSQYGDLVSIPLYAGTLNFSINKALYFKAVLTANVIITAYDIISGQEGTIHLEQDVTGGRTMTWDSAFKFINTDTSVTTAGEVNVYGYKVYSATSIVMTYMGHFTA